MDSCPAFATPFTGASVRTKRAPTLTPRRPSKPAHTAPSAVLGARTTAVSFGTATKKQCTVTVVGTNSDRCFQVEADTNLRKALLEHGVDLYSLRGKLTNCGGGGACGTCVVAVEDGLYRTSGRTAKEEHMFYDKPDSFRLACRTTVHGDVTIRTKPKA